MITIKGIEVSDACTSTQKVLGGIRVTKCPLYNICKYRDTIRTDYKPSDCPLIEIVTCKDCKNRDKCRYAISNNDYAYCSGAIRK